MLNVKKLLISLLVAAPLSTAAVANPVDNYGANAIRVADFATAESVLNRRLDRAPADHSALINLAYVYQHTARSREANALYARVLNRADVRLRSAAGTPVSSHDVARAGLSGNISIAMR